MINDSLPHESAPESSEVSKQDLADKVFQELVKSSDAREEMLSKIKWSMTISIQNSQEVPRSDERTLETVAGNARGIVAECVSEHLPLSKAETVFSSVQIPTEGLEVVSPKEYVGSKTNKKADVISHVFIKSYEEKPLEIFDKKKRIENNPIVEQFKQSRRGKPQVSSQEYGKLLREYLDNEERHMMGEIAEDYKTAPKEAIPGYSTLISDLYSETVIPDGIILSEGVPVGLLEVKGYPADELGKLVTLIRAAGRPTPHIEGAASDFGKKYSGADKEKYRMGVDVDKEAEFVDILRGVSGNGPDRDGDNLVVLRFPSDIPDNLLNQYGQILVDYGYPKVIIQKIPLSVQELDIIAKEVVKATWGDLTFQLLKQRNFSDRELPVLKKYFES